MKKSITRGPAYSPLRSPVRFASAFLWMITGFMFFLLMPHSAIGQCNPEGDLPCGDPFTTYQTGEGRYEFPVTPGSMYNLMGLQFCTPEQNCNLPACCPPPGSRVCIDLIFKITAGPNGELFDSECDGKMTLMTAQGNFDAAYLKINGSDPMGGNVDCASGIDVANNYTVCAIFNGQANGDIQVTLTILDKDGNAVPNGTVMQTVTPSATAAYAIITICKPGFGCLEDEFVFGCCSTTASIALDAGAPSTICTGGTSTLKFSADQGVPPYTVHYMANDGVNPPTMNTIAVGTLGGPAMAMATLGVSPAITTTYTIISVEDHNGCAQPPGANDAVTVTVVPDPTISITAGPQTVCAGIPVNSLTATAGDGLGTCTIQWQSSTDNMSFTDIPNENGAMYSPSTASAGTTYYRATYSCTGNGCTLATSNVSTVTVNSYPVCSISEPMGVVCPNSNGNQYSAPAGMDQYGWSISGNGTIQGPTTNASVSVSAGASGSYTLTVTIIKNGCSATCMKEVSISMIPFSIVFTPQFCSGDPGPVIGLNGSEVGAMYQLQTGGGSNLGSPVAGTGSPISFGTYPNGNYQVIITGGTCTGTLTAAVQATAGPCGIAVPDFCTCDAPDGYSEVVVKVAAPDGQNWTVKDVIGLYSGSGPYMPLAIGTPLVPIGGNMYTLTASRSTTKGYWVQVTNGYTVLDIAVGNAAW